MNNSQKVKTIDRNERLNEKTHDQETQNKTPLVLTYNSFLPKINNLVRKHWNILNISRALQVFFQDEPITAFKRNRNLKKIIGSNCIENGRVKRTKNIFTIAKCSPCLSKTCNLYCSQLPSTMTFISQQTKRKFKIFHKVNCIKLTVHYLRDGMHAM